MDEGYREVRFDLYCKTCKHKEVADNDDPCEYCLDHPVNLYSQKPVNWEEDEPKNN